MARNLPAAAYCNAATHFSNLVGEYRIRDRPWTRDYKKGQLPVNSEVNEPSPPAVTVHPHCKPGDAVVPALLDGHFETVKCTEKLEMILYLFDSD